MSPRIIENVKYKSSLAESHGFSKSYLSVHLGQRLLCEFSREKLVTTSVSERSSDLAQ